MLSKLKQLIKILTPYQLYIGIGIAIIFIAVLSYSMNHNEDKSQQTYVESNTDSYSNKTDKKETLSKRHQGETKDSDAKKENKVIYVDIKGAVKHPNVYKMNSSDRIIDLLKKAQLSNNADTKQINLSEKLIDQKLIYIPEKGEKTSQNIQEQITTNTVDSTQSTINLNVATEEQLLKVPVIGPSKAKEIIDYKNKNGAFNSIEDLKNIKGFGPKTFEKLKAYFTV
ncbi:helix-hairpin-helix domain-containing protein [Staphylococcus pasteuri]|uniref:helix-hairpin-helix domain-containing protein n=1 Tax=Staphylococcus pasteuri TaxID=45972 RepID=UPI0022785529|nr:helix-hairpin-helix domain-containing protein [Staphylococcus pasteuri]WAE40611.1 helix-hairpin-helix domain-containing protein [Staphylococcus pasteuri]